MLNQSNTHNSLYGVGEQAFAGLFNGITGLKNYFKKCNSIQDIMCHAREDIGREVMFSEEDDKSLPFEERFRAALVNTEYMADENMPDSYNFFILVFGGIQQAIDVMVSCVEYGYINKKQVDQIVLISGVSDFVSAAKLAIREGIDFLDPLGAPIKPIYLST